WYPHQDALLSNVEKDSVSLVDAPLIYRFHNDIIIGEYTYFTGNLKAVPCDRLCIKTFPVTFHRPSGSQRIVASAADGEYPVIRLDDLTRAAHQQHGLLIHDNQHRLELPEDLITSPLFREFNSSTRQISVICVKVALTFFKQCKCIRYTARKARYDFIVEQASDLPCSMLHHYLIAERNLTVSGHCHPFLMTDGKYRRSFNSHVSTSYLFAG